MIFNSFLPIAQPTPKVYVPPVVSANKQIAQNQAKESEKTIKLNDTANKRMDDVLIILTEKLEKQAAYVALLEQQVKNRDTKVDLLVKYAAKLKAENSKITLLTVPRPEGDTLAVRFTSEDMQEFIKHIADSVKATIPPDSLYFLKVPHRKNILSRTYYDTVQINKQRL